MAEVSFSFDSYKQ